ncbi:MAG: hypothetical protein V2J20_05840 [Wenzhouxiangella sp.]|jgi:hypothetical protein|nr:hypothetical protein [Wenzhouxiangella sp.]
MEDFTIGLALYDFVPVLLSGLAVYFIASVVRMRGVPAHQIAAVAAGLVFAAGLSKAIWKLIATLAGQDLVWLASMLFPLMAPGFALLAAGVWASQRRQPPKTALFWLIPLVLIAAVYALAVYRMGAGIERGWFMPIMALASLSNIGLTILLFTMAWRRGLRGVAILFTVNLGMVFALIPIAQMDSHSIVMHWLEQTLTAVGAAAFAYSAFRLSRNISSDVSTSDVDPAVSAAASVESGLSARSSA